MSDFEFDCMKKKQLAGQAKYRKRGSKSKKCSLPSDGMTQKQWKEKCGPVISYNPNKPMIWDDFKKLPTHIQAEYITNLQQKFGVTAVDLGKMFGVQALTVRKHTDANNLGVEFPRGHALSAAKKAEWEKFVCPEQEESQAFVEPDDGDDWPVEEPTDNPAPAQTEAMKMKNFSLRFSGNIDVNMIANSLKWILGESSSGELEIICNLA